MSNSTFKSVLLFCLVYFLISVNARPKNLTDDAEILSEKKRLFRSGHESENDTLKNKNSNKTEIPTNFDWRDKKAVTSVKNQGECDNSDWAFAALGALETHLFLKNKTLVDLSPQELIDCSNQNGNYGCEGGDPRKAFHYIEDNGIQTEESYPFQGKNLKSCRKDLKGQKIAKNSTIILTKITEKNETEMKRILVNGPILAVIDAYANSFINYQGGIYYGKDCDKIGKHNVLIVGYGVTNTSRKEEFWIVKNSWGTDWGEEGYIRMARNRNTCGIASNATYIEIV
ncbi:procathepsin L-like [Planococcus citri]|uniref:procathepsin L-like n=1 Tax=Planococcus citri TaxID=170843 RepID=UPI0031F79E02